MIVELLTPAEMDEIMKDDYLDGLKDGWKDGWTEGWRDGWIDAISTTNASTTNTANTGTYSNINTAPTFNWVRAEYLGNLPPMTEEEFDEELNAELYNIRGLQKK